MVLFKTAPFQFQPLPQQILFREQRHQSAEGCFFSAEVGHTLDLASAIITVTALMRSDGGLWPPGDAVQHWWAGGKNTLHVFTCTYIRRRARKRCLILSAILSPHSLYLTVQFISDHFCCKFMTILKWCTFTSCHTAFKCLMLCLFLMVASKFVFQIAQFLFTEQTWTIYV